MTTPIITTPTALTDAVAYVQQRCPMPVSVGVILGSGWGAWADEQLATVPGAVAMTFEEMPGFPPKPTGVAHVLGHKGRAVMLPQADGSAVMLFQGRIHYYQGYAMADVPFTVRLMAALGAKTVVLTNAAGGIHPNHQVGDVMVITDHLNLTGTNPLLGLPLGLCGFIDMTTAYDAPLAAMAVEVAKAQGLRVHTGVYVGVTGPCYETPAEVRMFQQLGGDAVGMSTVAETIVAKQLGLRVLGLSCITNAAAGKNAAPLNHQEVLDVSKAREKALGSLLDSILGRLM
jgi:purine-nucleoside phosphorylase